MRLQLVKMTIPRKKSGDNQNVSVTILPAEREKPVNKVLVAIMRRLYREERKEHTAS